MRNYTSLSDALMDLKKRGYTRDFNLLSHAVECREIGQQWIPEQFFIDEFYRFEGMSNPDDNSVIYAISSLNGEKGTLVDAYGVYADNLNDEMIRKLAIRR